MRIIAHWLIVSGVLNEMHLLIYLSISVLALLTSSRRHVSSPFTSRLHMKTVPSPYSTLIRVNTCHHSQCIEHVDRNISLSDYMRLPVDQYVCIDMPMQAKLQRLERASFQLTVPPVNFFHLQVRPTVFCNVTQNQSAVIIQSDTCTLEGSPYIRALNKCFRFNIQTVFTWVDRPSHRYIFSSTSLFVEVDPPPPFSSVPIPILERTGQLAMGTAISFIEREFITSLSRDYANWATNEKYRISRAKHSNFS